MKKGFLVAAGFMVLLTLMSFASATGSCPDNQTIMRLSADNNAHAALWNQTGYDTKICYNDRFVTSYTGSNSHSGCTSKDNGILFYLYSENNSHANQTSSASYSIPVCYSGLANCKMTALSSKTNPCQGDNKCKVIAYVSSTANAHLNSWSAVPTDTSGYYSVTCDCIGDCAAAPDPNPPSGCVDYTDNVSCSSDTSVAPTDQGCKPSLPYTISNCSCSWNDANHVCEVSYPIPSIGTCQYGPCTISKQNATECAGTQVISLIAKTTTLPGSPLTCNLNPPACKSSSAIIPCGSLETNLPFFGAWQLVASLISIAFVYALLKGKRLL